MDALTLFRQAAAQLQQEDAYLRYAHARQQNDDDPVLQERIGQFNLLRLEAARVQDKPEDDPHRKEVEQRLQAAYAAVMETPSMQNYSQCKTAFDTLLAYINAIIQAACDGEDPMLVQEPHGCTGHCSSCGGCGG